MTALGTDVMSAIDAPVIAAALVTVLAVLGWVAARGMRDVDAESQAAEFAAWLDEYERERDAA